ncbi:unnamed protein product [Polarella glacialis]|uniref:Uncharacterized protein n=1 Tax=Polarella glacialis TaxID=89957 RepID=A0A813GNJ8_POLGL|nr:unnamed protein product [Polarella glacialis]|mmetsp:Transcript_47412/g.85380  ORF Transcript_47412/g.85380 Transcript_47412/m.85380 type:complete len:217 (+) Transcript_47412:468-1118(+)
MGQAPCSRGLPGGWQTGDRVFYASASQLLPSGDSLVYGAQGEITGASDVQGGNDDKRVAVQFAGNSGPVACLVETLSPDMPSCELRGGWRVGETLVYVGSGGKLHGGDELLPGSQCEVVGPGDDDDPLSAAVFFTGHSSPVVTSSLARTEDLQSCPALLTVGCFEACIAPPEERVFIRERDKGLERPRRSAHRCVVDPVYPRRGHLGRERYTNINR